MCARRSNGQSSWTRDISETHLSLASWHAEAISKGGMMARALLGANKKTALTHFEQAMALAPDRNIVLIEYAAGLLMLERRKGRSRARDMLRTRDRIAAAGRVPADSS